MLAGVVEALLCVCIRGICSTADDKGWYDAGCLVVAKVW